MEKDEKSLMPSQEERPDIYDSYDFPPGKPKLSEAYKESMVPETLRARRAAAARDTTG